MQGQYELDLSNYFDPEGEQVTLEVDLQLMTDFAVYSDESFPMMLIDTDQLGIIGVHEAKITLKDVHDNTNQYILVFEITSSIP